MKIFVLKMRAKKIASDRRTATERRALCHFFDQLLCENVTTGKEEKMSSKSQFNEIKNCKFYLFCLCFSCHLKWNSLHVVKCIRWMTSRLAVYKYSRHLYHSIRFPMASFTSFWIHIKKHHWVHCNIFTLRALFNTHTQREIRTKTYTSNGWCKRFRGNNILQHSFFALFQNKSALHSIRGIESDVIYFRHIYGIFEHEYSKHVRLNCEWCQLNGMILDLTYHWRYAQLTYP